MRAWRLPADVDTDQLAPGGTMKFGLEVTARHCLEAVRPDFAGGVQRGDVVVAGPSYGGLYQRNAFNVGLLLLTCPQAGLIEDGEAIGFDARAGRITRLDAGPDAVLSCPPIPGFLLDMVEAGGLLPQLKRRLNPRPERPT
jgi:3-isopropylmalate/(R)-2-methylmalate dehydratase small subunit